MQTTTHLHFDVARLQPWIAILLFLGTVASTIFLAGRLAVTRSEVERRAAAIEKRIEAHEKAPGHRLAEKNSLLLQGAQNRFSRVEHRLDRLDQKVDRILELLTQRKKEAR